MLERRTSRYRKYPLNRHPDDFIPERDPRLIGIAALSVAPFNSSSPRLTMRYKHGQYSIVLKNPQHRLVSTGIEYNLGELTYDKSLPEDAEIIKIVPRYRNLYNNKTFSPIMVEETVIYRDKKGRLGCIILSKYHNINGEYGFIFKKTEAGKRISEGQYLIKGTRLCQSPTVQPDGDQAFGRYCRTVTVSNPNASEDTFVMSEDTAKEFEYDKIETFRFGFGNTELPRNVSSDKRTFQAFPDVGEVLRDDGILCSLFNANCKKPGMFLSKRLGTPNYFLDNKKMVRFPGAEIIDIKVTRNLSNPHIMPKWMTEHVDSYADAFVTYYDDLLKVEKSQRGLYKELTPSFHRLLVEAYYYTHHKRPGTTQFFKRNFRRKPLEPYSIEITVKTTTHLREGHKITGNNGEKGVISKILPRNQMPVDEFGNHIDLYCEATSTISRMNTNREIDYQLPTVVEATNNTVKRMVNYHENMTLKETQQLINQIYKSSIFDEVKTYLLNFYKIISACQYRMYCNISDSEWKEHLVGVLYNHINILLPSDNNREFKPMIRELVKAGYTYNIGRVRWPKVDTDGKLTHRNVPVRLAEIIVLDKDASDGGSVSMPKNQIHGIPAPFNAVGRQSEPTRSAPPRIFDEAGFKINGSGSPRLFAEVMDFSSNAKTQRDFLNKVFNETNPMKMETLTDRKKNPYEPAGLTLFNNILTSSGVKVKYEPENLENLEK